MGEFEERCEELRFGTRLIFRELNDPWGHIAARLPRSDARQGFVLKHVRVAPPPADPNSIMVFDYDGNLLEGERIIPWEIPIYVEIFKTRPEVESVIHTHPHAAVGLSMGGKTVYAISQQSWRFGHGIPVFPGDFINTPELGSDLAKALGQAPAVLMKGHGAVTVGQNIGDAVQNTLFLEQAAKQQIWAASVGQAERLEDRLIHWHGDKPINDAQLAVWYTKMHFERHGGDGQHLHEE